MDSGALAVGIDAGGTTTRLLVLDAATGAFVAEAEGDSAADGGPVLDALARGALGNRKVGAVCAGIAKISRTGVRERWETEIARLFPDAAVRLVVPDYVIAFHGATGGVGIAVIAGTGSVVYGEDGRRGTDAVCGAARVGGRGWEYGDEGSGAWLTAEMVRRTLRALDGLAPSTPLMDAVCDHLGTRDAADLAERARQRAAGGEGRGFLVPLLAERANAGDAEAGNLFVGAAGWLGLHVRAAAARLAFDDENPPCIAPVGGLWEAGGERMRESFGRVVGRWLPRAEIIAPRAAPVHGAAQRAVHALRSLR